jgi:hypothetical protein
MKQSSRLFAMSLFVFLISVGHSQESGSKVGIGLSIDPFRVIFGYTLPITPVLIYVPVKMASMTIEPYAGMFTRSSESSFGTDKSSSSASLIQIGGGLLFSVSSDATSRIYFGPRVSVLFVSSKSSSSGTGFSSSSESSETDFIFGAALGGEYSISSMFSVGGEVQFNYFSFGKPDVKTTPPSSTTSDQSRSMAATNGALFLRFYP